MAYGMVEAAEIEQIEEEIEEIKRQEEEQVVLGYRFDDEQ